MLRKFLTLFLAFPILLHATEIDVRRHIEVDGTAEILVAPDFATWRIVIRGEANSLEDAANILEESSQNLRASLASAGFPKEIIKLSGISSGRYYNKIKEQRVFMGFFAERDVIIELRDLTKRQRLEQIILKDNRVKIDNITAQSSKHEENRKKALMDAISIATEKASALADAVGSQIGVALSIKQGNTGYFTVTSNRIEMPIFGDKSTQLEALSYSSTVTVKFELK